MISGIMAGPSSSRPAAAGSSGGACLGVGVRGLWAKKGCLCDAMPHAHPWYGKAARPMAPVCRWAKGHETTVTLPPLLPPPLTLAGRLAVIAAEVGEGPQRGGQRARHAGRG
jgi:hypothetical protein